ncbi:WD repeat-containing protein 66 [Intoshia linei]|uniref:Cilia- and flagella-associated protein 251 n=1 Tax=Intoshia linei TaxID=1819745 RepID=A0A177AYC7_9BILA|nr:WD repeat-containing protein 66 [Intoshia linei]
MSAKSNEKTDNGDTKINENDALSIFWTFGYNHDLPVINLSDSKINKIAYAANKSAIIYDESEKTQTTLKGHCNKISFITCTDNKKWMATTDIGYNNKLIIWDVTTCVPIRTYFEIFKNGIVYAAFSHDFKYLAILSHRGEESNQKLYVYDWSDVDQNNPKWFLDIFAEYNDQIFLKFHQTDHRQLLSNSDNNTIFYYLNNEKDEINNYSPPLTNSDYNKVLGNFTQSVFLTQYPYRALTATCHGLLIVWDSSIINEKEKLNQPPIFKKSLKLIQIQEKAINVLEVYKDILAIGGESGTLKFFDQSTKLLNWYSNCVVENIVSLSFDKKSESKLNSDIDEKDLSMISDDATINTKKFIIDSFVISSTSSIISRFNTKRNDFEIIIKEFKNPLVSITTNSTLKTICCQNFGQVAITSMCYEPNNGSILVIGTLNGNLHIVNAITLESVIEKPLNFAKAQIIKIIYSSCGKYIVTYNEDWSITLFYKKKDDTKPFGSDWLFGGRHRAHYGPIVDILFGEDVVTKLPRLLSLSHDRHLNFKLKYFQDVILINELLLKEPDVIIKSTGSILISSDSADYNEDHMNKVLSSFDVEYSINLDSDELNISVDEENSNELKKGCLKIVGYDRIELVARPIAMIWHPAINNECFIQTINDELKFKLYNSDTKMCRKTILAPIYASKIKRMINLPKFYHYNIEYSKSDKSEESNKKHYIFFSNENIIGLQLLPASGDPAESIVYVAHDEIVDVAISGDGLYAFTCGGKDGCVHQWLINTDVVDIQISLNSKDANRPFHNMIVEATNLTMDEIEDFFYHAQIRGEGVNSTKTRSVGDTILLEEIPYMMKALGNYSSEKDIEDMTNEIKYSQYSEKGEFVESIGLNDFIKKTDRDRSI